MDLNLWLFKNRITKKEFASSLGIHRGHLHGILSGREGCSRNLAKKIYRLTGAKVKFKTRRKIENWDK